MGEPFGDKGELFTYSLFLVLTNRVFTFICALCALRVSALHRVVLSVSCHGNLLLPIALKRRRKIMMVLFTSPSTLCNINL